MTTAAESTATNTDKPNARTRTRATQQEAEVMAAASSILAAAPKLQISRAEFAAHPECENLRHVALTRLADDAVYKYGLVEEPRTPLTNWQIAGVALAATAVAAGVVVGVNTVRKRRAAAALAELENG